MLSSSAAGSSAEPLERRSKCAFASADRYLHASFQNSITAQKSAPALGHASPIRQRQHPCTPTHNTHFFPPSRLSWSEMPFFHGLERPTEKRKSPPRASPGRPQGGPHETPTLPPRTPPPGPAWAGALWSPRLEK